MEFKPEDFPQHCCCDDCGAEYGHCETCEGVDIATRANAKLKEWLDAAPTVYSGTEDGWLERDPKLGLLVTTENMKAKLVCIEEIKGE